jgi:YNFM family putative membrane transporter
VTASSPSHNIFGRRAAVAIAGFCSFINLYAPQPLLPSLMADFRVSEAEISLIISSASLAIALIAPFTGAVADVLGRKRVIVTSMFAVTIASVFVALSHDLSTMVLTRFIQGLLLPPVFAVTVAYVGEELPPVEATIVTGIYTSASSFGGFFGRFIAGALTDYWGWQTAFMTIALMTLAGAFLVAVLLPREQRFVRASGIGKSLTQIVRHLGNTQLLAAYAVGFGVLFNFIGIFTYVSFRLAEPPFSLSATALGMIFVVYLAGVVVTPWVGGWAARVGRRRLALYTAAFYAGGMCLTLLPSLPMIVLGLALVAGGGFVFQALGTAYVAVMAKQGRSAAVGLYVTGYYLGGSAGAVIGGFAWTTAGWLGCVILCVAMAGIITLLTRLWQSSVGAD